MVVGQDNGSLVLINLTKERDSEKLTHYLETQVPLQPYWYEISRSSNMMSQAPVTEHEDQLTGLDIWETFVIKSTEPPRTKS